jgi:hypothetical protein
LDFVISLLSANVTYRVDGVSGLNVLTGIKSNQLPNQPSQLRSIAVEREKPRRRSAGLADATTI